MISRYVTPWSVHPDEGDDAVAPTGMGITRLSSPLNGSRSAVGRSYWAKVCSL